MATDMLKNARSESRMSSSSEGLTKSLNSKPSSTSVAPLRQDMKATNTLSRKPTLGGFRKRMSLAFSHYDFRRAPATPSGTECPVKVEGQEVNDKYWRPLPFAASPTERELFLTRNDLGLVEVRDTDKTTILYETNIPFIAKSKFRQVLRNQVRREPKSTPA